MTRSRLAQQVRNFLAHQILGFAGAQQAMADRLSETSLAYKDSPLSVGSARGLNGPAPGQRIVDGAAFGHGDTPLFALMAAPEEAASDRLARFPTLLEGGVRAPVDENGIWLVRPDGYVAVASRAGDWAAVDEYLSSMKSPPHAGLRVGSFSSPTTT